MGNLRSRRTRTNLKIIKYVQKLLKKDIKLEEIDEILKKIGIEYDPLPITKIIIENDLRMKKVFLKLR